ncbi:phospholipid carrier-dependent glycosyltransferase [Synechococcus sp. Nb3U1]|uniref:ArnT family glycosyltransferase n=1 Tax=Synechococcus sp. Nb3U1 TaxID=1914529 RepID=UPI001F38E44A|nr:phospholipid carrier-dependent glycosyltransferase [Synechococcus sp. Nb3U1]MCF2971257.1 phospholipid carrier-dependent glycosyltransferase [Synechococcus sp. Nb3U1]
MLKSPLLSPRSRFHSGGSLWAALPVWPALGMGLLAGGWLLWWQGIPFLFDWDELIYGSLARQMLLSGDPLSLVINGEPFFEKPPLFFWLQALAMSALGVNEWAARLPNAWVGGMTVALLVAWGSHLRGVDFGCLWGSLLLTGYLPLFFAKTGLIDPLFNLGMGVGMGSLFAADQARLIGQSGRAWLGLGALALGLAVLAKGPLGLGLPLLIWAIYKLWHPDPWPHWGEAVAFLGLAGGVALSWFVVEWMEQGPQWVEQFLRYQWRILTTSDGHPGPVYFHVLAFGLGCFPWGAVALAGILQTIRGGESSSRWRARTRSTRLRLGSAATATDPSQRAEHLLLVAFGVVLALFSLLVQTKLVHYTSLLYPIGAYFAAGRLQRLWARESKLTLWETLWILLSGLFWVVLWLVLPWLGGSQGEGLANWGILLTDGLTLGYLRAGVDWPLYTYGPALMLLWGGLAWIFGRQKVWGWVSLLLATGLSAQLAWGWVFPRLLQHTQGGSIQFFQRFVSTEAHLEAEPAPENSQSALPGTVGLYGFRSFVPYFYGPLQVPYAAFPAELSAWERTGQMPDYLVTWDPFVEELAERGSLQAIEQQGPFWLLKTSPSFSPPP